MGALVSKQALMQFAMQRPWLLQLAMRAAPWAQRIRALGQSRVAALLLAYVLWKVRAWPRRLAHYVCTRLRLDDNVTHATESLAQVAGTVLSALLLINKLTGRDATAQLLSAGTFGVLYALQDTVANFFAGLMLLTLQPFRRGDIVFVAGQRGRVTGINLRYTTLKPIAAASTTTAAAAAAAAAGESKSAAAAAAAKADVDGGPAEIFVPNQVLFGAVVGRRACSSCAVLPSAHSHDAATKEEE
jgi:small-conductance mechanosensitive channel